MAKEHKAYKINSLGSRKNKEVSNGQKKDRGKAIRGRKQKTDRKGCNARDV